MRTDRERERREGGHLARRRRRRSRGVIDFDVLIMGTRGPSFCQKKKRRKEKWSLRTWKRPPNQAREMCRRRGMCNDNKKEKKGRAHRSSSSSSSSLYSGRRGGKIYERSLDPILLLENGISLLLYTCG